ncbi:2-hydroxyacyl-CoA dehydratase [Fusobacterium necrophorum]|uniref:2-hydroxyacyl-CoA dehydratase n=1 Tax=Fusobacterium necrophorum TaxID=859 RepID=UPI00254C2A32|nr:2-hydroxyacyl-CoA dehydratase [Fusobacterium necrophorum]MDK4500733.1 2-hydroxyacyl-CoA dehydratase [Fusobacterium necrophorum]
MDKSYKILIPMMLDIHFDFIAGVLQKEGYDIEVLQNESQEVIEEGLKNVHNDMCYPALLVIGQFIHALKSGRYNVNRIALLLTQTGGGCRASNYICLLRKALDRNKFTQVKVLSLNFAGLDKENEFSLSFRAGFRLFQSILYGDLLMLLYNQSVAFEKNMGESKKILACWKKKLIEEIGKKTFSQLKENYRNILEDFASIPKNKENRKIKVGIVGEIYMKYSPLGNNHLTEYLEQEKAEVVNTGILDFLLFNLYDTIFDKEIYGKGGFRYMLAKMLAAYVQRKQGEMIACIKKNGHFRPPTAFSKVLEMAKGYLGHGVKMGEGWLLTAEMLEFIHMGVHNIICAQPFGCLPNHIIAKGMIRKIKTNHPEANIVAVDYDPGASSINQENRIRLMLENARSS